MATITVKNIPDALYEQLKSLAKARHRSLNSEIIHNLERSLGMVEEDYEELRKQLEAFRNRIRDKGEMLDTPDIKKIIDSGRA